jgi:hypothetical protein
MVAAIDAGNGRDHRPLVCVQTKFDCISNEIKG